MPRKILPRDKAKEQFWRRAIARQLESGLSQSEFCRKEGLSANNFSGWKVEIARRDAAAEEIQEKKQHAVFVPLAEVSAASQRQNESKAIAEIDIAVGIVRIFAGIDRHSLHEIVAALREVSY